MLLVGACLSLSGAAIAGDPETLEPLVLLPKGTGTPRGTEARRDPFGLPELDLSLTAGAAARLGTSRRARLRDLLGPDLSSPSHSDFLGASPLARNRALLSLQEGTSDGRDRPRPRLGDRAEDISPTEGGSRISDAPEKPAETPEGGPGAAGAPGDGTGINWDEHFTPMPNRWFIRPPPYFEVNDEISPINPYQQNLLKGDFPIYGEDLFLNLIATDFILAEGRRVPTPTGITGPTAGKDDFFGDGEQFSFINNFILELDLFKGQQAFKPVDWRIKASAVYNNTFLKVEETGAVNINVDNGDDRWSDYLALQEAFVEYHLGDISDRYDFISAEAGILAFRSDFRGFIFEDSNLGYRFFGNADNNKYQYNLVLFDPLEKDTNSELNRFEDRDQTIFIANLYRQDFLFLGYNALLSFHYNKDDGEIHFNRNGFLTRPKPAGLATPHEVEAYYLGWAGEGHIGPINITHAFYQVFGKEDNNEFAARDVDINAQLAALELSYDVDWFRPRIFALYQSGDDDTRDGDANGFDGITEAPNFAGGEASFFNRQEIRLLGTGLTQRLSPYVDLSSSKFEGSSNFVNPGLLLLGTAVDVEVTPTQRMQLGFSYLRFLETDPLETFLEVEDIDEHIGSEIFFEYEYRPFLTNNIIFKLGFSPFFPGDGFAKIYQRRETLFSGFVESIFTW